MSGLKGRLRQLRVFVHKRWVERELDEELAIHIEMETEKNLSEGMSPAEARRAALMAFGGVERTKERVRDARWTRFVEDAAADVRLAVRTLLRSPGYTAVVVLTLALGVGVNTAVFAPFARALIDRLPYPESQALLVLYGASSRSPDDRGYVSATEIEAIRQRSRTTTDVGAFGLHGGHTWVGTDRTEVWAGTRVDGHYFQTLGVPALLGRTIDARDAESGAAPVVVLSHPLWVRAFGADAGVVGRSVQLEGVSRTVIGVMPPDFVSPWRTPEIWVPLDLRAILSGQAAHGRMLTAVARLRDSAALAQARAELTEISRAVAPTGDLAASVAVNPVGARDAMVGGARTLLLLVMGAALLLLALACVNLAALSLTRWTARRPELVIRTVMGARPWRLVQHTLAESVLVGLASAALGIGLAVASRDLLFPAGSTLMPAMGTPSGFGPRVMGFAAALSIGSGLAFGLAPALWSARTDPASTLDWNGRGTTGGRRQAWLGRVLAGGQVALAVLLLVGAGLLGRTVLELRDQGMGYQTADDALTFFVNVPDERYAGSEAQARFFAELLDRIRALPAVEAAGLIYVSPWNGWYDTSALAAGEGGSAGDSTTVSYARVSDGLLSSLGIPLLAGRDITAEDGPDSRRVVLVSEGMARRLWPDETPIGSRVRLGTDLDDWATVVGVVGDVRGSPTSQPRPAAYLSAWHEPIRVYELVVRSGGDASHLIGPIRSVLRGMDPGIPLVAPRTMANVFAQQIAPQRVPTSFLMGFALLALVLAALGIYGVVSYSVGARAREIGIRAALGGRRARILMLVLGQGLRTTAGGAVVGLVLAAGASRVLASILYGVSTHDLTTFVVAPVVLLVVSGAASLVPAVRATWIDPREAMRQGQ